MSRSCPHCAESEARELRQDHARWFARKITSKNRASFKELVRLMSDLDKDIELAEAEFRSGGDQ